MSLHRNLLALAWCLTTCGFFIDFSLARENGTALLESISKFDQCVIDSTFSFNHPNSYPPKDMDEYKRLCQSQAEAIKCIKEKTKGGPPLLRRGMVMFAQLRTRHHKKVCKNLQSETSKRFLEATKCLREKRFEQFKVTDDRLIDSFKLIFRRNYDDPSIELKQVCCVIYNAKKASPANIGQECKGYSAELDEMMLSVYPNEVSIVCDEDDKLAKVCASLEPIRVDEKKAADIRALGKVSTAGLGLYLVATLGEPQ